jgi:hypothetical protein
MYTDRNITALERIPIQFNSIQLSSFQFNSLYHQAATKFRPTPITFSAQQQKGVLQPEHTVQKTSLLLCTFCGSNC